MKILSFIVLYMLLSLSLFSQGTMDIRIAIMYGQDSLQLNKMYIDNHQDSIAIQSIKFYLSNFEFYNKHKIIYKEANSYHLIDINNLASTNFQFSKMTNKKYTSIKFNLGIDSITNTSGALGGDLDPTKGMYWTWQSGYINFKIEGIASSSNLNKHFFEYHIGGYNGTNNAIQPIELKTKNNKNEVIIIDLDKFCSQINFANQKNIKSPSADAVQISRILASCFSLR